MTYEELLEEAEIHELVVKEKPLRAYKGRIKGNRIAIKKDLSNTDKKCTLAEEIGHYHTTVGNILDQSDLNNRKQERYARAWGYRKLVRVTKLIDAYKHGVRNRFELAEYLGVTEEYIEEVLIYYKQKYGLQYQINNYLVCFEPLSVLEIWE
ncbi:ImmA/IrrE family metallo-endopeptidase [Tissierella sp. MB52-C2]|uniref:ImmA/IrrE family metallo-endopeptidase n=1 Tax=Tissierella sp. MB52-C2 TaxID=3070999 RepID=UPI00280AF074|nr:ImmA/IrrE family metallo-endopeptidase [Tissierella sp. MB52-C2]WMM23679.1 ImmA/IrrE family metallo-endopeptidase [Tissierella sp. MB52-C2]